MAETVSNGLDKCALGAASIRVYFELSDDVSAPLESNGTFDTQLFMRERAAWVQVPSILGFDDLILGLGSYRWDAGAGTATSGYDYYSASAKLKMGVQAIPLPPMMLPFTAVVLVSGPGFRSREVGE